MDYKDYYKTLGVSRDAKPDEIQKAYRKLARKYHPDVNHGEEAENRFKEINEAHQVLSDPEKRSRYDQFGSAWERAQGSSGEAPGFEDFFSQFTGGRPGGAQTGGTRFDFGDGSGFSSFFESLFGGGGGFGSQGFGGPGGGVRWTTAGGHQAGRDHEARLALSIQEAAHGGERQVTLTDPDTGSHRTLRVKIPAGVRPGQRIRLGGQGGRAAGGGAAGNLYLTLDIAADDRLRLEGADLHAQVPVTPWEAALGGEAEVPTLDGNVTIRVPAGSSSGRRIRLRGRGFPRRGKAPGDLIAELRIVVPEEVSEDDRKLYEELARTSRFKPRQA